MSTEDDADRVWRVGELAADAGVSVRALHHYDEVGLLSPSQRTSAGHRIYTTDDVRRLHRILALRGFGLSLSDVGRVLDGDTGDVTDLVRRQIQQAEAQLRAVTAVRDRLRVVLHGLDAAKDPSPQLLLEVMEAMSDLHRRLTPAEFEELCQGRRRWAEGLADEEWAEVQQLRAGKAATLTDAERARMAAARAAIVPEGWTPPDET